MLLSSLLSKTQFDLWQKWAEQNKSVFKNLNTALDQKKRNFYCKMVGYYLLTYQIKLLKAN